MTVARLGGSTKSCRLTIDHHFNQVERVLFLLSFSPVVVWKVSAQRVIFVPLYGHVRVLSETIQKFVSSSSSLFFFLSGILRRVIRSIACVRLDNSVSFRVKKTRDKHLPLLLHWLAFSFFSLFSRGREAKDGKRAVVYRVFASKNCATRRTHSKTSVEAIFLLNPKCWPMLYKFVIW